MAELVSFAEKVLRRAGNVFVEQMSTTQDSPPAPTRRFQQRPKVEPRRGTGGVTPGRLFPSQLRIMLVSRKLNYLHFNILSLIRFLQTSSSLEAASR